MAIGMRSLQSEFNMIRVATIICSMAGLVLSCYALFVEVNLENDPKYEAMCDISEHVSCTTAFNSEYGKGFGIVRHVFGEDSILNQPNSVFGIIFYSMFVPLGEIRSASAARLLLSLSALSCAISCYLAYLLAFVLHDFCVVCVATYAVNALLLAVAFLRVRHYSRIRREEKSE